ncbi:MAG: cellulose binding domain-containing protein [Kineosporiaceae bacterium]
MSIRPLRRGSRRLTLLALAAAVSVAAGTTMLTSHADAAVKEPTLASPATGNATWFDALGQPFGGCGVPQADLETQNWLALNVYNTPGDYTMYERPMPEGDPKIGVWNNGKNCGRWIRITMGDRCGNGGVNDGAPGAGFCHGGSFVSDQYNGATLDFLVADSCGDPNGWCRDDPFHLDLAKDSIDKFVKDGKPVGDLLEKAWGNRHISWSFIEAPNYTGDIKIGFTQGSQKWWTRVAITRLPNGIHSLEYWNGTAWVKAANSNDMGQSFLISPTASGGTDFKVRITDVNDQYLFGGREYSFSLPASCGNQCSAPNTFVDYTTSGGTSSPTPTTSSPKPSTTSPEPTTSSPTTTKKSTTKKASTKKKTSKKPVITKKCKTGKNGKKTCKTITVKKGATCAASVTTSRWNSGFQSVVAVQAGDEDVSSWTVTALYPSGQRVTQSWGARVAGAGNTVAATSGALAAGSVTSFGLIGTAAAAGTPTLTCSAS